jgi:hypothetical protein
MKLSDYRVDFTGEIEQSALGWVFRALDLTNYYGMKLRLASESGPGRLILVRYAVVKGEEKIRTEQPLSLESAPGRPLRVRLDVAGPRFTTYVEQQPVNIWTDHELQAGGFGFANERTERAKVKTVQMSYLSR